MCTLVAGRISSGLELVDLEPLIERIPDLVVWTLIMGRMGASGKGAVRAWFWEVEDDIKRTLGVELSDVVSGLKCFEVASEAMKAVTERKDGSEKKELLVRVQEVS